MAYQKNIPQGSDKLKNSQDDLLGNFQALNTDFGVNHVTFDAASNRGKHNKLDMPNQTVVPTAAGTDFVLYNVVDSDTTQQELIFKSSDKTYPISGGKRDPAGFAYIGGGMIMVWGQDSAAAGGDKQITPSPALNPIYHVQVTPFTNNDFNIGAMAQLKKMNTADFIVRTSNLSGTTTPIAFFWTVIGKRA